MRRIGLVVLIAALAAAGAFAQQEYDFNIMGTGARARGMGGAFIGVADDATAVGWNPAGLAQLEKMEASVVGLFNITKYSSESTFGGETDTYEESASHPAPAFASFVIPLKTGNKNLALAVAYQRMVDMGNKAKGSDQDYGYFPTGDYDWTYEAKGGMDAITPAIAVQLSDNFSFGAAGNIYINGVTEKQKNTFTADQSITDNFTEETKFSGFNFNAGALVSLQKFSIGAMMRFPFNLKIDITNSNDYTNLPTYGSGSTSSEMSGAEFSMPMIIGFGAAVKPTDKLTLAADYEIRPYSNSEFSYQGTSDDAGMNDCNQLRVGMEYIFTGPNAVFPIRLGFRTDPKTFDGFKGTWTSPDTSQASGYAITGGFGLNMGRMMLDLAYEYGNLKPIDVSGDLFGYQASMMSEYKSHNIMASAIFHF
ncbi:type IX secretion system membrane protein PorP/SprF [bacterium]|nr:type IX secretion system membrane protein PorP/SprF [bacterium]